ncbi:hypothetical protein BDV95DRAFT_620133, partial [Massariosphaeria phaeospora]
VSFRPEIIRRALQDSVTDSNYNLGVIIQRSPNSYTYSNLKLAYKQQFFRTQTVTPIRSLLNHAAVPPTHNASPTTKPLPYPPSHPHTNLQRQNATPKPFRQHHDRASRRCNARRSVLAFQTRSTPWGC